MEKINPEQNRRIKDLRFIQIVNDSRFPEDDDTVWWWDMNRKAEGDQPYIAVQTYKDKNPNDFVRVRPMYILFTDQAEYCAVCENCYYQYRHMQWSGSTQAPGWEQRSQEYLVDHQNTKGWCQFCDPVFGNGGWVE